MVEQKISLDFVKNGVQKTVYAKQGENAARDILISLTANGEPADISETTTKVIYPDGTHSVLETRNPVKVTIPQQMCVEVGEHICELQVTHGTELLYSPQFRVQVEGSILGASGSSEPIADPTLYEPLIATAGDYTGDLGVNAKVPVYDPVKGATKLIAPSALAPDISGLEEDIEELQQNKADKMITFEATTSGDSIVLSDGKTITDILNAIEDAQVIILVGYRVLTFRGYSASGGIVFGYEDNSERSLYIGKTGNALTKYTYSNYTAAEKTKLSGIESGAEANAITDVQDTAGNSLVTNKVAVIPLVDGTIEIVADEYYDLEYTTTEILGMYNASTTMTYDKQPVILVELYGSNGADIYYIGKSSGQIVVYRARYQNQTTLSGQIVVGAFSDNNYTTSEKTKLAGIETGAQVNLVNNVQDAEGNSLVSEGIATIPDPTIPVTDVEDSEGNSLVSNGVATIPDEVIELQTAGVLNYTISQIWAMKGKKAMYYNGNLVVRLNVTATDPRLYEIYYIDYNNYSPYDTMLCKVTYNSSGEKQGLAERIGHWFTTAEQTKLAGIESGAEVNVQPDWSQSDSAAADYIKNKPTIPTVPVTDVTVNGTSVVSSGTASVTVPTAGTITSGSTGYATGGDVYTVVGNVESALSSINTALEDLIGGE